jgi:twinkle protein
LFGWQALTGKEREIIICEGEIDCMSWYQYGYAALSIPRGAGKGNQDGWIESEYDNLSRFDTIYLSFDDDEEGQRCTAEVLSRLGQERCKVIKLNYKDCNEMLRHDFPKEYMDQCVANAAYRDPEELRQLSDFRDEGYLILHPELAEDTGAKLLIGKDVGMRFKGSEVTLWSGINGHGKSHLLNQLMLDTIQQGKDVCIASLEVKPGVMLAYMVRQVSGCRCPSDEEFHRLVDWIGSKVYVFDFVGKASHAKLLETFEYSHKRYGITVFLIDSMMCLDIKEEDLDAQKSFTQKVCKFANDFDVHLHLVAHSRKGRNEEEIPGKMDISGSGMIANAVSNIMIIWRNKRKEMLLDKHSCGQTTAAEELEVPSLRSSPDALLICVKNRNGEWEGRIPLWFHRESFQFLPYNNATVKKYPVPTLP